MSVGAPLADAFYLRDTVCVARDLIGCVVERRCDGGVLRGMIVEAEAYGPDDPASHAFRGRTQRNASMFGPPGRAYVYRIYGVHRCLNAVTREQGRGEAVLVRALMPLEGMTRMAVNRGTADARRLCRGPGALCEAMEIDLALDGASLTDWPLRIVHCEAVDRRVRSGPRVGVARAHDRPWRFWLDGSAYVSPPRPAAHARGDPSCG